MGTAASLAARFLESILAASGVIVGFLTAYLLFELTEWRRRVLQRRAIRSALRSELQAVEVLLNNLVTRFAVGSGDIETAVKEIRWFREHRKAVSDLAEMPKELLEKLKSVKDENLVAVAQRGGWRVRSLEVAIPLTTVDAVLSSPIAGLSPESLGQLTMLKWQGHLLAHEARGMEKFLDLSFEVTDPGLHATVLENHERAKEGYAKRAGFMLSTLRQALSGL